MKFSICCLLSFAASVPAVAQDFGPQQVITTDAAQAYSVFATDLDGDGDPDVLSASFMDDKIAWYENQGGGVFGAQQTITTLADGARSVYATDLDGDGDADVLSASELDGKIGWYENQGGGAFGGQQTITTLADGAKSVYATDLDGDGDADVLSGFRSGIAWYENQGGGVFGTQQMISVFFTNSWCVYATDLYGDEDADVLSAYDDSDATAWHENQGGGVFFLRSIFSLSQPKTVYATDLDGDGDADVVSVDVGFVIYWFENQGGGVFGPPQLISTFAANGITSVYATDLDGDGDADVLSASVWDDKIAWYENLGGGDFGDYSSNQKVITTSADGADSVYATDLDGDGDVDVLSASLNDDKIAWYENLMDPFDCNGNGIPDNQDIANGTSADCNSNGTPDECEIADDPSLDCDLDGALDSCQLGADPSLDCDGNLILDTCDIANDPSLDQDGDGVLDSCQCAFSNFCISTQNSTGQVGTIGWSGSASISAADLTITGSNLPTNQFGIFFYGADEWFKIMGDGVLCIAPPLYRIKTVVTTGPTGTANLTLDYGSQPLASGAGAVAAFSTWRFQLWYRDPTGGPAGSNTTDGLMVTFCP